MNEVAAFSEPRSTVPASNALRFFGLGSMPCEQWTAYIRMHSLSNMEKEQVEAVAYRYLQNKAGLNGSLLEIRVCFGLFCLTAFEFGLGMSHFFSYINNTQDDSVDAMDVSIQISMMMILIGLLLISLLLLLNILPNMENYQGFKLTQEECREWLVARQGEDWVRYLDNYDYKEDEDIFAVHRLFSGTEHSDLLLSAHMPRRVRMAQIKELELLQPYFSRK